MALFTSLVDVMGFYCLLLSAGTCVVIRDHRCCQGVFEGGEGGGGDGDLQSAPRAECAPPAGGLPGPVPSTAPGEGRAAAGRGRGPAGGRAQKGLRGHGAS